MGIERQGITAFLMAGAGFSLLPELRAGLALGWGVASVYNQNVVSVLEGSFRDQEIVSELQVQSLFIPKATASVVYTPIESCTQ